MKQTVCRASLAGLVVAGMVLLAAPASAHVSPDKDEVPADSFNSVTLSVGHGCEGSPTVELDVEIPEGINSVTPQIHPGWTIEKNMEDLDPPIDDGEGGEITERVASVTFTPESGNELPDGFRDTFTLGFRTPDTPGEYLFFKTVQTCEEGSHNWIAEYTGEGEEPEEPAPVMLITEAEEEGDDAAVDEDGTTDGEEAAAESPEAEADDSDDSNALSIVALIVGLLGLGAGGAALVLARKS
jgi:uncharacterized protein YcnI